MKRLSPRALYQAEKDRVARERTSPHSQIMGVAKAAFEALLAAGKAARRSGRPKNPPAPPSGATPRTSPRSRAPTG